MVVKVHMTLANDRIEVSRITWANVYKLEVVQQPLRSSICVQVPCRLRILFDLCAHPRGCGSTDAVELSGTAFQKRSGYTSSLLYSPHVILGGEPCGKCTVFDWVRGHEDPHVAQRMRHLGVVDDSYGKVRHVLPPLIHNRLFMNLSWKQKLVLHKQHRPRSFSRGARVSQEHHAVPFLVVGIAWLETEVLPFLRAR